MYKGKVNTMKGYQSFFCIAFRLNFIKNQTHLPKTP